MTILNIYTALTSSYNDKPICACFYQHLSYANDLVINKNSYTILPKVLGHPLLMKGLTTLVISMSTNLNV